MSGRCGRGIYGTRRWKVVRRQVFDRDGWRCTRCGRVGRLECDHVVPVARGGAPFALSNLRTLCRGCHVRETGCANRRALTPDEAAWRVLVRETLYPH